MGPRQLVLACTALVLALSAAVPATSAGAAPSTFTGIDGQTHDSAPYTVPGLDGELFYGPEFDTACAYGDDAVSGLRKMTALARIIERSGRTVVWTDAQGKTAVVGDRIGASQLPHGTCDSAGLEEKRRLVDTYAERDPLYLPLRAKLAGDRRQVYFKTDAHWTTVGASVFAKSLIQRLEPRLKSTQHYAAGTESRVGLLATVTAATTGQPAVPEQASTALPDGRVTVTTASDSVDPFDGYPAVAVDHSWNATPARLTYPGRTLVVGDSFACFALPALRPMFRHGRYLWVDHVELSDIVKAIKRSDTVVLEIYQNFLSTGSDLLTPQFRRQVRRALR